MSLYAPFDVRIVTPRIELHGATDDLLEQLVPIVRAGGATADPPPWDDPSAFYEEDPDRRVEGWLQGIWRGRGTVRADAWRLYFVVLADGEPVGSQDLTGHDFNDFGSVESTSWIAATARGKGFGLEARAAILHLAFEGLGASEANSEAGNENLGSNRISERLGYKQNGVGWATHAGEPVLGTRWRMTRDDWLPRRRHDITMTGIEACRRTLGID